MRLMLPLTVAYLAIGADKALRDMQAYAASHARLLDTYGGHVGVVDEVIKHADTVLDVDDAVQRSTGHEGYAGMFEYEVTEELGAWLVTQLANQLTPSRKDVMKKTLRLIRYMEE